MCVLVLLVVPCLHMMAFHTWVHSTPACDILKKFIDKEIRQQVKRSVTSSIEHKQEDECRLETVSIPFIDGLSQEVRRIARTAGIRCAFSAPNAEVIVLS